MTTWAEILGIEEEGFLTWDDLKWYNKIGCYCASSGSQILMSVGGLSIPLNMYLFFNPNIILQSMLLGTLLFIIVFILTFIGFHKSTRETYLHTHYYSNPTKSLFDLLNRGNNKKKYKFNILGFSHRNHKFDCTFHIPFAKSLTRKEFTISADDHIIDTLMELKKNKQDKEALEFLENYLIMECL